MTGLNNIGLLLVLAVIALAWWNALGARAAARSAARRACRDAGVGYIDEIALQKLALGRDHRGMLCLKRRYGFEFFVSGNHRYAGQVWMHARRVTSLQMDPYPA